METKIFFKKLTASEIRSYIDLDQPLQNAGVYKIQERGAMLVEKIEGDYNTIVGLPLSSLVDSLKEFNVHVL